MLGLGSDGVPSLVQSRTPSPSMMGLSSLPLSLSGYSYSIFKLGPLQFTQKGLSVASTAACLTFTVKASFVSLISSKLFFFFLFSIETYLKSKSCYRFSKVRVFAWQRRPPNNSRLLCGGSCFLWPVSVSPWLMLFSPFCCPWGSSVSCLMRKVADQSSFAVFVKSIVDPCIVLKYSACLQVRNVALGIISRRINWKQLTVLETIDRKLISFVYQNFLRVGPAFMFPSFFSVIHFSLLPNTT